MKVKKVLGLTLMTLTPIALITSISVISCQAKPTTKPKEETKELQEEQISKVIYVVKQIDEQIISLKEFIKTIKDLTGNQIDKYVIQSANEEIKLSHLNKIDYFNRILKALNIMPNKIFNHMLIQTTNELKAIVSEQILSNENIETINQLTESLRKIGA